MNNNLINIFILCMLSILVAISFAQLSLSYSTYSERKVEQEKAKKFFQFNPERYKQHD